MSEDEKKRPSFEAFSVKDGPEDRSYFNRIGAAFPHKDGKGHTIALDAVPLDGKVVLRTPQERNEDLREKRSRRRDRDDRER